jgi:PAS domain S-box-containing protein
MTDDAPDEVNRETRRPLAATNVATAAAALIVAGLLLVVFQFTTLRRQLGDDTLLVARMTAMNAGGALLFGDAQAARETLAPLALLPGFKAATLRTRDGALLAHLPPDGEAMPAPSAALLERRDVFDWTRLEVALPVIVDGQPVGTVAVRAGLGRLYVRTATFAGAFLLVGLVGLALSSPLISRMRGQVERAERRVREQASLLDEAHDAIIVIGLDQHVRFWNRGAQNLYQWRPDEAIGRLASELFFEDGDAFDALGSRIVRDGDWRGEVRHRRRDGSAVIVESHWTLVRDHDGFAQAILAIDTDISARKRAEQRLEFTMNELRARNRELRDFAFVASHDLQEPLRKVRTFGSLLLAKFRGTIGAEGAGYLDRMTGAVTRMQTLIDDLLDYSRTLDRPPVITPVPLTALVHDVIDDLGERLRETGGRVEVDALPTVWGDATRLRQLFQNLVGNALKFHAPGRPPIVQVRVAASTLRDAPAWRIDVIDNGIGFAEEYRERIFAPFQRLHSRAHYAGTGIGLAIVRAVVQRHGGTVTASATAGSGATFTVVLPQRRGDEMQELLDE